MDLSSPISPIYTLSSVIICVTLIGAAIHWLSIHLIICRVARGWSLQANVGYSCQHRADGQLELKQSLTLTACIDVGFLISVKNPLLSKSHNIF